MISPCFFLETAAVQKSSSQSSLPHDAIKNDGEEDINGITLDDKENYKSAEKQSDCSDAEDGKQKLSEYCKVLTEGDKTKDSNIDRDDIEQQEDEENTNNAFKTGEVLNEIENCDKNESHNNIMSAQNSNSLITSATSSVVNATVSKIPILQSNLRQAKCASWAGGELTSQQIHTQLNRNSHRGRKTFHIPADVVNFNDAALSYSSTSFSKPIDTDIADGVVFQNPDMTDLTPGLFLTKELDNGYCLD